MKRYRLSVLFGMTLAMVGCSASLDASEAVYSEASEKPDDDVAEATSVKADWSGLNNPKVQAAIAARVEAFAERTGYRYGFLAVDRLDDNDRFLAAGKAAWDLGTPAIVASIQQRDIQIVGDEALAYFEETRGRIADDTSEYFDRGEFEAGVQNALAQIEASWNEGD